MANDPLGPLSRNKLLKGLTDEQLRRVAGMVREMRFPAKAVALQLPFRGGAAASLAGIRAGGVDPCGLPGDLSGRQWRMFTGAADVHGSSASAYRCGGSSGWTHPEGGLSSCFPFNPAAHDELPEHQRSAS